MLSQLSSALQAAIKPILDNIIFFFLKSFPNGTVTTTVVAGFTLTAATISVVLASGKGQPLTQTLTFAVPGPEAGAGLSFLLVAAFFVLFRRYQSRRSSAI